MIVPDERAILRDLAKKVAEIAQLPIQQERAELWRLHNDLKPVRPMVLIFPEGAWREMLPESELRTTDRWARGLEADLRRRLYYHEHMPWDDNVIEAVMPCGVAVRDSGWGLTAQRTLPEQPTGAYHFEPVIKTEADIEKIKPPQISVDHAATERHFHMLSELFGDILTIEKRGHAYNGFAIMDTFASWRGLDQMFWDLVDRPQWVHQVMEKMYQCMVIRHEAVIASGAATLNNRNHYTGSGGTGYTRQLPQAGFDGVHARSKDLWAHATTQMFSEVSPAMHEEFALQYERKYLARFGLSCYGCCEPLHHKLNIVKTIPNLRRVSISPWADIRKSAEGLGNRYIYSYKPNPAIVAGESWDPEAVRKGLNEFLSVTKGCVVEIVMKDTHTCRDKHHRMWEWTRIAKEAVESRG